MQDMSIKRNGRNFPVINMTLNPNFRNYPSKYRQWAKKICAKTCRRQPHDLVALMSSKLWKYEFKTSMRPYTKPQRKIKVDTFAC